MNTYIYVQIFWKPFPWLFNFTFFPAKSEILKSFDFLNFVHNRALNWFLNIFEWIYLLQFILTKTIACQLESWYNAILDILLYTFVRSSSKQYRKFVGKVSLGKSFLGGFHATFFYGNRDETRFCEMSEHYSALFIYGTLKLESKSGENAKWFNNRKQYVLQKPKTRSYRLQLGNGLSST